MSTLRFRIGDAFPPPIQSRASIAVLAMMSNDWLRRNQMLKVDNTDLDEGASGSYRFGSKQSLHQSQIAVVSCSQHRGLAASLDAPALKSPTGLRPASSGRGDRRLAWLWATARRDPLHLSVAGGSAPESGCLDFQLAIDAAESAAGVPRR
jgi:hypothetical protein